MMKVKPKWAFMIPMSELSTFHVTTDYIVMPGWDPKTLYSLLGLNCKQPKILLLNNAQFSGELVPFFQVEQADVVVLNDSMDPGTNLSVASNAARFLKLHANQVKIVGVWHGEKKHLESLTYLTDEVALPRTENRIAVKPKPGYWFLGFKNYDEILRLKPEVVITGAPFTAAKRGDLLQTRVRRPKNLDELDFNTALTNREATIALQNINFLRSLSWEEE